MQKVSAIFTAKSYGIGLSDCVRGLNNQRRTETKDSGDGSGQNDGPWDSGGCVRSFLRDMHGRVERA